MRTVTFNMDPVQYERLREFAESVGMKPSELIRETLDDLLNVPPEMFCYQRMIQAREELLCSEAYGQKAGNP